MYIRFVTAAYDEYAQTETGIFYSSHRVANDLSSPDWLREELRREFDWFDQHLAVPDRLQLSFRRGRAVVGICWFRPNARDCLGHARYIAWLMTEAGVPVEELRVEDPGQILYRDAHQVVAKPPRDLPRVFQ